MVYLPTFTIHINQMYVNMHNIPYMDPMGVYIYNYIYITFARNPLKSHHVVTAELQDPCHQHLLLKHCAFMKLEM